MKYNLKNRPIPECSEAFWDCENWFEGFKKELQEWYGQCIVDGVIQHSLVYILIKEILGE